MRVLVNHLSQPPSRITGLTVYTFSILRALLDYGDYDYSLVTTWPKEDLPSYLQSSKLKVITRPYFNSTAMNFFRLLIDAPRLTQQTGATVILNTTPIGAIFGAASIVTVVHDLYHEHFPRDYRARTQYTWKSLFAIVAKRSHRLICVSNTTRDDLETFYPSVTSKTVVVYEASPISCVDESTTSPPVDTDAFVLFVANVTPTKNVSTLIAALDRLRLEQTPVTCIHIGRDDQHLARTALAQYPSLSYFSMIGSVDDTTLLDFYRRATCLIIPSLYEGFCLPVLEAQTLGLAIIAADIPTLREIAGDGAMFFPPNDSKVLADCIRRVTNDRLYAAEVVARGKNNVQRFDWRNAAQETERVIAESMRS